MSRVFHLLCAAFVVALTVACANHLLADPADDAQRRFELIASQVGYSCNIDRDCTSPLRCIEQTCMEPPAMTGAASADAPMVLFYGEGGEALLYVEIAADPLERERGLMHRHVMVDDWGMIFIYPNEQPLSFWMRDTHIPLDMVFVSGDLVVVGVVENAEPLTTTSRAVEGLSRFVVELNAGKAAQLGIRAGVRCELLNFPPDLLDSAEAQ